MFLEQESQEEVLRLTWRSEPLTEDQQKEKKEKGEAVLPTPVESLVAKTAVEGLLRVADRFSSEFVINNGQVKWGERELDFKKLLPLKEIIDRDLSDEDFQSVIPNIEEILLNTWVFKKLNSKDIKVSRAHTGTTPFEHTIYLLEKLKTAGLPAEMVRAIRWGAIWHDIGKIFGADREFGRFHGQLSASMCYEFFYTYCSDLSPELIQQLLFVIQFHHTSEGFDYKWLVLPEEGMGEEEKIKKVEQEAKNRLGNWDVTSMLYVLCAADILSVREYEHFVNNLNKMINSLQPHFYQRIGELYLLQAVLAEPHSNGYKANGQHAQPTETLAQPQY